MPRIDFYSLAPDSRGDRFLLTCRLVERIRAESLRILILCPDREQAQHLDRLLWTFREDSFIPHGIAGRIDPGPTPVIIGEAAPTGWEAQVLLNLSTEIPGELERFERLCEPIDHEPGIRAAGRERFRQYRDRGFPLEHHQVRLG